MSTAILLTKEDGTGKNISNSYANVADGDAYHLGHLYGSAWTDLLEDAKASALVMASRLIDAEYQFGGRKAMTGQAMQWPRIGCREPDGDTAVFDAGDFYPRVEPKITVTPAGVGQSCAPATELARPRRARRQSCAASPCFGQADPVRKFSGIAGKYAALITMHSSLLHSPAPTDCSDRDQAS